LQREERGMSNIIHVKPAAPGEITYDTETKTATHVESGLAVQFLRWHTPEPRETEAIFRLTWQGQSYEFKASLDGGAVARIMREFPDLSTEEQWKIGDERNYSVLSAYNIGFDSRTAIAGESKFIDYLLNAWNKSMEERRKEQNSESIMVVEFIDHSGRRWECRR
jgi:hypothetical protein